MWHCKTLEFFVKKAFKMLLQCERTQSTPLGKKLYSRR